VVFYDSQLIVYVRIIHPLQHFLFFSCIGGGCTLLSTILADAGV
jgi:hypothetical protein